LWEHIRRVVRDASGVVIDMGRRSRLFTGAARQANGSWTIQDNDGEPIG
jgi:hypothetical protein